MKKQLAVSRNSFHYVLLQEKKEILKELINSDNTICFGFSLFGSLGQLHEKSEDIKSISIKASQFIAQDNYVHEPEHLLPRKIQDELNININYLEGYESPKPDEVTKYINDHLDRFSQLLVHFDFNLIKKAHQISLQVNQDKSVSVYCSSNSDIKENINNNADDPSIHLNKDDVAPYIGHYIKLMDSVHFKTTKISLYSVSVVASKETRSLKRKVFSFD